MDVRIIVETTVEAGEKRRQELNLISLPGQGHGDLGLKLEHGKSLLAELQRAIVNHQIQEIADASRNCLNSRAKCNIPLTRCDNGWLSRPRGMLPWESTVI